MDYLRGNATASAVGLFVICGYLSGYPEGRSEGDIIDALQVLRRSAGSSDESAAVFTASRSVGQGLGIIQRLDETAPLRVEADMARGLNHTGDQWPWFRGELLHRIAAHGLRQVETEGSAPDLVLGLTWFLQNSPLRPIPTAWASTCLR